MMCFENFVLENIDKTDRKLIGMLYDIMDELLNLNDDYTIEIKKYKDYLGSFEPGVVQSDFIFIKMWNDDEIEIIPISDPKLGWKFKLNWWKMHDHGSFIMRDIDKLIDEVKSQIDYENWEIDKENN